MLDAEHECAEMQDKEITKLRCQQQFQYVIRSVFTGIFIFLAAKSLMVREAVLLNGHFSQLLDKTYLNIKSAIS